MHVQGPRDFINSPAAGCVEPRVTGHTLAPPFQAVCLQNPTSSTHSFLSGAHADPAEKEALIKQDTKPISQLVRPGRRDRGQSFCRIKQANGVGMPKKEGRGERALACKVKKAEVSIAVFIGSIPLYGDSSSHRSVSLPRLCMLCGKGLLITDTCIGSPRRRIYMQETFLYLSH